MKTYWSLSLLTLVLLSASGIAHSEPAKPSTPLPAAAQSAAAPQPNGKPQAPPTEITGEVVDAWCYASQTVGRGRGPEHARCAIACGHGGVTLGILDDKGNLYIAGKSKAYQGCQHLLLPFIAKRVHVTGWVGRVGGCPVLKIGTVELAKDNPKK